METNQEHWRDWKEKKKSDFLASWDFQQDKETLTITEVKNEIVELQKKEKHKVAYFKEERLSCGTKVKPMILNNTNCQFLHANTGLRHQSLWKNIKVEISVVDNPSKFGGKMKLVITKAVPLKAFDVQEILSLTDHTKAKELASQNLGRMTPEEIETVKKHLETIKK